jgi:AGCS family alanine or glycine:cation symporter
MTGLVLLTVQGAFPSRDASGVVIGQAEHAWQSSLNGFAMTSGAYQAAFPAQISGLSIGSLVASVALILFSFTTLLTWSDYGERAVTYLSGGRTTFVIPWRVLWCVLIVIGSVLGLELVWRAGDIANAMMAFHHLVALVLLSGVVVALAKGERTAGIDHGRGGPAVSTTPAQ